MNHLTTAAIALLSTLALGAHAADAAPRSWTAARAVLPDDVNILAGANVATLRGTALYQQIVPPLIAKDAGARRGFELAKSACNIDLHAAIDDATIAMADDERGVVVLALGRGLDHQKLVACFARVSARLAADAPPPAAKGAPAPKPAPPKLGVKTTGKITEYTIPGEATKLYLAWLAKDVVAISTEGDDRAHLERMIGGKGARTLGAVVSRVNTNAMMWFASTKTAPMQQSANASVKAIQGTVDAARGTISVDVRARMGSAQEAKQFVGEATAMVAAAKAQVPAPYAKLVDALRLAAIGADATVKVSVPERDLQAILSLVMASL